MEVNYFMDRTFPHFTPRSTVILDDVYRGATYGIKARETES